MGGHTHSSHRSSSVYILGKCQLLCSWIIVIREASCNGNHCHIIDSSSIQDSLGRLGSGKSAVASYLLVAGKRASHFSGSCQRQDHSDNQQNIGRIKIKSIRISISVHTITPFYLRICFRLLCGIREGMHLHPFVSFLPTEPGKAPERPRRRPHKFLFCLLLQRFQVLPG